MDLLIAGIFLAFLIMVVVNYIFFLRKKKHFIEYKTIMESNFSKVMLASYIIFSLIFVMGLIYSSLSSWLILPIICVTFFASVYYATLRKNLSLMSWGIMSIAAIGGIFLDLDRTKMSLLGIIGLATIALTLHLYNKEKASWQ
jgi:hypothetical protein